MTKSKSYIATPPGATIREQLEDRGMSQKEFAIRMGLSEKHISHLINGEVQLTQDVAYKLEMVFGIPANFWNNLESIYREKFAKVDAENALTEEIAIAKKFPYSEMVNNGWISAAKKPEERVILLRKYFEVAKLSTLIQNDRLIPSIACRRQTITEKADFALITWVQKAKLEARNIQTAPINLKGIQRSLPQIRSMTTKSPDVFVPDLVNLFAKNGVAVVFLPHIGESFLHGATFIDANKIVMGLTVGGKDTNKSWFSLFHELGHIILGHLDKNEDITDQDEITADEFAKNIMN